MTKQLSLLLAITLSVFAACKDKNAAPAVKFKNDLDKNISVTVYYSQADYYRETNPVAKISIAAGATGEMKGELFENGRDYYYDVLSDDMWLSNWGTNENGVSNSTTSTSHFKFEYPVQEALQCTGKNSRLIYLGQGKTSVNWDAVVAIGNDGSYYEYIKNTTQSFSLLINKDYTSVLSKADSLGNVTETHLILDGNALYDLDKKEVYNLSRGQKEVLPIWDIGSGHLYLCVTLPPYPFTNLNYIIRQR